MNKIKEAQENFLKVILDFYKSNPNQYFTSKDITEKFDLYSSHKYWFIHGVLKFLNERGELEKSKNRKGFRYINKVKCE